MPIEKLIRASLNGSVPILIIVLAFALGAIALQYTAREEEPQIVVPMVDVLVKAPGLSARQVERQVTFPLEKLLSQIKGVENVYSSSQAGQTAVTLRFFVGQDREEALFNTYNKLYSNQDNIPGVISNWLIKPVEVDDVPIMVFALWSDKPEHYSHFELRRIADELTNHLQAIPDTSVIKVVGGRPRTIRILPKTESLAARQSTSLDIVRALKISNTLNDGGLITLENKSFLLESGDVIRNLDELKQTIINVVDGRPVFLQDVAEIIDGPDEIADYTTIRFSDAAKNRNIYPMVTISVAKKPGSNAVSVAQDTQALLAELKTNFLPADVKLTVLRDYGATADEKVSNLTSSLAFAVFTVIVFVAVFLGWRPAVVVGLAIPISYGITLALDMAFGYTINRVTLFALILSLGLLVDDPITSVDNIARFIKKPGSSFKDKIVAAMLEIQQPLLMSTLTIILSFIPLAFITGMMGPYMAPMAFNVPMSVIFSTVVAFLVSPWLASRVLAKAKLGDNESQVHLNEPHKSGPYFRLISPFLENRKMSKMALWAVLFLFIGAALLPVFRLVPLKLLPFDNKNELQILVDMPESASLEQTANLTHEIANAALSLSEIHTAANFIGLASPIDFNGMVRRYYQRSAPYFADIRLLLVDKTEREHQSHGIVLRLREHLKAFNRDGVSIKVVEVPPGPPVLSTLTVEVYGSAITPYEKLQQAAEQVKRRLQAEPFVTEVDDHIEVEQQRLRFITDKQKAALSGISTADINQSLIIANDGIVAGYFNNAPRESKPLPLVVRLPEDSRGSLTDLASLPVKGQSTISQRNVNNGLDLAPQGLVPLGELGEFQYLPADKTIYHKDLEPVVYVTAELSGRTPAEVIADIEADFKAEPIEEPTPWQTRNYFNSGGGQDWDLPEGIQYRWTGEGEWKITVEVFRDMGLAFAFALIAIFVVLKIQTQSVALSLIIMSAIPLTIIGIMPGFFLLNQFGEREIAGAPEPILFTATAMIGMIALAGIVVRNSLILVEFIEQARRHGLEIKDALIAAGTTRMRPILLTAGTTLLGNLVITLDPVFSGLALAIIFGILASTLFTLVVIPLVYYLVFGPKPHSPN